MTSDEYTVGLATPEHIALLPAIERAAAALFPDEVITPEIRASVVPHDELEAALIDGRLWTATTATRIPVGFAVVVPEGDDAVLQEIDVHPEHQRKGLGRRLIQEVVHWSRANRFTCVSLTTFEYVPWNAPFYASLGFRKLAEHELTAQQLKRLQQEQAQGMRQRVAMRLALR